MSSNTRRRAAATRSRATAPAPAPAAAAIAPAAIEPAAAAPANPADLFDLDAVRNEAGGQRFQFKAGDRIWYLRSPEELDWLENSIAVAFTGQDDLRPFLRQLLSEQYEKFIELRITIGKVRALIGEWQKYHGVKLPESSASPRS